MSRLSMQQLVLQCVTDIHYTCGCGLYVHPNNPHANRRALHMYGCPYQGQLSLAVRYREQVHVTTVDRQIRLYNLATKKRKRLLY